NPSGAFEVFYDFRPMESWLSQVERTVWAIAPSGFFVLCFGMVALMQVTTRTSHRHDESLRAAHLGTYRALASAVDARDSHTGDHSSRVAAFVIAVARRLDLPPSALAELEVAARVARHRQNRRPRRHLDEAGSPDVQPVAAHAAA